MKYKIYCTFVLIAAELLISKSSGWALPPGEVNLSKIDGQGDRAEKSSMLMGNRDLYYNELLDVSQKFNLLLSNELKFYSESKDKSDIKCKNIIYELIFDNLYDVQSLVSRTDDIVSVYTILKTDCNFKHMDKIADIGSELFYNYVGIARKIKDCSTILKDHDLPDLAERLLLVLVELDKFSNKSLTFFSSINNTKN